MTKSQSPVTPHLPFCRDINKLHDLLFKINVKDLLTAVYVKLCDNAIFANIFRLYSKSIFQ